MPERQEPASPASASTKESGVSTSDPRVEAATRFVEDRWGHTDGAARDHAVDFLAALDASPAPRFAEEGGLSFPKGYADNPLSGTRIEPPLYDRPGLVLIGTTGHIRGPFSLSEGWEIRADAAIAAMRSGAPPLDLTREEYDALAGSEPSRWSSVAFVEHHRSGVDKLRAFLAGAPPKDDG